MALKLVLQPYGDCWITKQLLTFIISLHNLLHDQLQEIDDYQETYEETQSLSGMKISRHSYNHW